MSSLLELSKHAIDKARSEFPDLRHKPLKKVVREVRKWYDAAKKRRGDDGREYAKHDNVMMVTNGYRVITINQIVVIVEDGLGVTHYLKLNSRISEEEGDLYLRDAKRVRFQFEWSYYDIGRDFFVVDKDNEGKRRLAEEGLAEEREGLGLAEESVESESREVEVERETESRAVNPTKMQRELEKWRKE